MEILYKQQGVKHKIKFYPLYFTKGENNGRKKNVCKDNNR